MKKKNWCKPWNPWKPIWCAKNSINHILREQFFSYFLINFEVLSSLLLLVKLTFFSAQTWWNLFFCFDCLSISAFFSPLFSPFLLPSNWTSFSVDLARVFLLNLNMTSQSWAFLPSCVLSRRCGNKKKSNFWMKRLRWWSDERSQIARILTHRGWLVALSVCFQFQLFCLQKICTNFLIILLTKLDLTLFVTHLLEIWDYAFLLFHLKDFKLQRKITSWREKAKRDLTEE